MRSKLMPRSFPSLVLTLPRAGTGYGLVTQPRAPRSSIPVLDHTAASLGRSSISKQNCTSEGIAVNSCSNYILRGETEAVLIEPLFSLVT